MRMSEGIFVRDHMILMIRLFEKIKILRVAIVGKTQVDMVLETLLDSFKQFKLNYSMNKMVMNLTELRRELQTTEGILKDQRGIHIMVKGSLGFSSQKKKNISETIKQKERFKGKEKRKKSQCKGKCFLYGKKVHWKKKCQNS